MSRDRIVSASWAGTALFAVTAVGALSDVRALEIVAFIVAIGLFAVGTGVFIAALVVAAGRSRTEEIGMGGLFFMQGTAPRDAQKKLLGSLVAQTVIAFATAAARPYTSLAFGILTPVYALGLTGLWVARHGVFPARTPKPRRV